ncbi:Elongator subunit elp4 [Elasticomyces elasticus]|nr:Elongator subunit elp4 [Elasticomyces elasticus]
MAFRKRNIGISNTPTAPDKLSTEPSIPQSPVSAPGTRPSPLTGHPTTSTGTPTLDNILGGHAGLALGSSLLIEESGTTDFAGALLRYFAAEGILQGHTLHVVGVGEQWVRELPGVVGHADDTKEGGVKESKTREERERMKIAWRYERLGEFDAQRLSRAVPDRFPSKPSEDAATTAVPFCHTFDLAKRLIISPEQASRIHHIPIPSATTPPFTPILRTLSHALATPPQTTIHRLIIPALLSPTLYPPHASTPAQLLQFLHSLRALSRQHPSRLATLLSVPTFLHPRSTGLLRWAERLSDGVIELQPFPHLVSAGPAAAAGEGGGGGDSEPQGLLRVHKLPVNSERGGAAGGEDLVFVVSRRKFVIRPFSLPPVEGDREAQRGEGDSGVMPSQKSMEF